MKKKRFDLGIRAGALISMAGGKVSPELDRFIGIQAGKIAEVGAWKASRSKDCKRFVDGSGQLCLPGFVNGHTHLPMTLFRGLEDDVPFHVWLFERILPLEGKLVSRAFVRDGTELAALECIRFGVTTVNEMYFYAGETAATLDKAGLRAIIAQTLAKFPLPEDKDLGTDKFAIVEKLLQKYKTHDRIEIALGPHAPYSCDDKLLLNVAAFARDHQLKIHIHVAETEKEVADSVQEYGKSPVARLQELGLLREGTLCAHCVHLSESDRAVFADSGAAVIYNPDSNMKLGSGTAPVADYLERGIPVALGTDGSASNNDLSLFGAMDIGTKLQKLASRNNTAMVAEQALWMATLGGAEALGLSRKIGSLEEGKSADLLLLDLQFPHLQPVHSLLSQVVYAAQGLEVATTICAGNILFHRGKFLTISPKRVFAKAGRWREKIQSELRAYAR